MGPPGPVTWFPFYNKMNSIKIYFKALLQFSSKIQGGEGETGYMKNFPFEN
jgi:hypothetical protein